MVLTMRIGDRIGQRDVIKRLTDMQYERNEMDFHRGTFRVRGDIIDVFPAEHAEQAVRISLFDDEIDGLQLFDPLAIKIDDFKTVSPVLKDFADFGKMPQAVEHIACHGLEIGFGLEVQPQFFLPHVKEKLWQSWKSIWSGSSGQSASAW